MKSLFKYLILAACLAISFNASAQLYEKFPTNVRYIGGGFNNKQPFFKTLEAALNNVKATATAEKPYGFWVASDTVYISDWDSVFTESGLTMKDSIDIYYVATGKIKWLPFGFGGGGEGGTVIAPDDTTYYYGWHTWNILNLALPLWQRMIGQAIDDIDEEVWRLIVYTQLPLYVENDTLKINTSGLGGTGWDPDTTTVVRTTGNQTISGTKTVSTITMTGNLTFNGSGNIQLPSVNGSVGTARRVWGDNDKIFYSGSGAAGDTNYTAMISYTTKYLDCDTCIAYSNLSSAVKDSLGKGGTATFNGTNSSLNISVTGMTATSIVIVTPIYTDSSTAINAQDLMVVIPYNGGFYIKRSLSGTNNLKVNWAWIRKAN